MSEGRTQAEAKAVEAALEREAEGHDTPAEVDPHDDRTREFSHLGFSRMRVNWHGTDAQMMASIRTFADNAMLVAFGDAYRILNDIYEVVREPKVVAGTGEVIVDSHGFTVWETNESGRYIEDYSRLGIKQREEFLFQITTRLVEWEQEAADAWGEAMFAKAAWEERFSVGFFQQGEHVGPEETGTRKTDEAMTQRARLASRDERYFALFKSYYSRRAEALIRSIERLSLRLSQSVGK